MLNKDTWKHIYSDKALKGRLLFIWLSLDTASPWTHRIEIYRAARPYMLRNYSLFSLEEGINPAALADEEEVARGVQGDRPGKLVVNVMRQPWKGV